MQMVTSPLNEAVVVMPYDTDGSPTWKPDGATGSGIDATSVNPGNVTELNVIETGGTSTVMLLPVVV